jgi:putative membrane protein
MTVSIAVGLVSFALAAPSFAASDKAFLKKAMEGDNSEVHLGKLAEQKGSSQGVRDFGRMLEMDHGMHKDKVAALASSVGGQSTDDLSPEAKREDKKLQRLSGPKFDREFADYMVKDHRKDISDYEKQAKGKGPVADMARDTLPTLRKHLETAQHLTGGR